MDGSKSRMVLHRGGQASWRDEVEKTKGKLERNRYRQGGGCRKNRMSVEDCVVPPLAATLLRRILGRLQVVGHRDHWKEDQDEHRQGNNLRPASHSGLRTKSLPIAHDGDRQQCPREIESQLHILARFYISRLQPEAEGYARHGRRSN